jgi:hypothetical protein
MEEFKVNELSNELALKADEMAQSIKQVASYCDQDAMVQHIKAVLLADRERAIREAKEAIASLKRMK